MSNPSGKNQYNGGASALKSKAGKAFPSLSKGTPLGKASRSVLAHDTKLFAKSQGVSLRSGYAKAVSHQAKYSKK
jgi:hypothetical protein